MVYLSQEENITYFPEGHFFLCFEVLPPRPVKITHRPKKCTCVHSLSKHEHMHTQTHTHKHMHTPTHTHKQTHTHTKTGKTHTHTLFKIKFCHCPCFAVRSSFACEWETGCCAALCASVNRYAAHPPMPSPPLLSPCPPLLSLSLPLSLFLLSPPLWQAPCFPDWQCLELFQTVFRSAGKLPG